MQILRLTLFLSLWSLLTAFDVSWPCSYLSVPFKSLSSPGTRQNLIKVEINRYPYVIDISLHTRTQYYLALNQMAGRKEMTDRPDYRKHEENVFGLVEFVGVELPDRRLEAKRRYAYQLYYYASNLLPRLAWFNMESIQQIPLKERPSQNSEGSLDLGPTASNNPIIKDLKRFNEYMKYHMVSFKLGQQQKGQLFLGGFPVSELADGATYASVKLDKQGNYWRVLTQSLSVKWKREKSIEEYFLVKEMVRFRLTISSPLLILPRVTADGLERTFPQCKFEQDALSPRKLLTCRNMGEQKINDLQFEVIVTNSAVPLTFRLTDLVRASSAGLTVFEVSIGEDDELQLGATLLQLFLLGIDYREGLLHYGRKAEEGWFNRFIVFKTVLILNAMALIISLVVIAFERKLRVEVVAAVKEESQGYRPRASGYQMAQLSEDTTIE